MILLVDSDKFIQSATLFPPLDLVHLPFTLDAEKILQNAPAGAWFNLRFDQP